MRIAKEAPYYDDYDPNKEYVQILARPETVAQAREFTQSGTIFRDYIGRLGDAVFKNASVISGLQLTISEDRKTATILPGELYFEGLVRRVTKEVKVAINGVGSESIGVKLISDIVTEVEDKSLRDPAQSYENYNREGAHRLKESIKWVVNDSDAVTVFNLKDGQLVKAIVTDSADWFTDILARRTFDENGNYKISGLELQERNEIDGGKLLLTLSSGKAYIQGYEVIKPSISVVSFNPALAKREVKGEPKTYTSSNSEYILNNSPFSEFTKVSANVQYTQRINRGNSIGGTDFLIKTPVAKIVSVTQESTNTTYQIGKDFNLIGDSIDWSLNGSEPNIGTEYTVVYEYIKQMELGVDLVPVTDKTTGITKLKFQSGKDKPVNNSLFYVDYKFFLARTDLVCLDKDGNILVLEGIPEVPRLVRPPVNQDGSLLVLGSVTVLPDSTYSVRINNEVSTRLTQKEIYNLLRRIQDMEYNQAITDLDEEAATGEPATNLKGIYTDGFVGFSKCDFSAPEFDCSIDIENKFMTLPFEQTISPAIVSEGSVGTQVSKFGDRLVTARFTHQVSIDQNKATSSINVNPYAAYDIMSLLEISPKVDNWIDTETVVVNKERTKTNTVYRTNRVNGGATTEWDYQNTGLAYARQHGGSWRDWQGTVSGVSSSTSRSTSSRMENGGSDTSISSKVILDEVITFMRPIKINVKGSNFSGGDTVECYFNNKRVPLTPGSGFSKGSTEGSVKVNSQGIAEGYFTIPTNTPSGVVDVELKGKLSSAETSFRSEGRRKVMEDTVLVTHYQTKVITTTETTTRVIKKRYDPVAQSFELPNDSYVSKVGLYFKTKDTVKPLVIQIRPMDNGFPESKICAEALVYPDQIKTSSDGTAETSITLDQPVFCKANQQFAVCVLTDSNKYEIWYAERGKRQLGSGEFVTSQPYVAGVMFTSSNGATWSTHQDADLKFRVYTTKFTDKGSILFNRISLDKHTRLKLAVDYIDYNNAGMFWYYKTSESAPWVPLIPYQERPLSSKDTELYLKAELNHKSDLSPLIALDATNIILYKDKGKANYVMRSVFLAENYTKLKITTEMRIPSGTTFSLFYNKTDTPGQWTKVDVQPTVTPLSYDVGSEYSRYEWNITSGLDSRNYKFRLELNCDNVYDPPMVFKVMNILKY